MFHFYLTIAPTQSFCCGEKWLSWQTKEQFETLHNDTGFRWADIEECLDSPRELCAAKVP